jgi:uncharacterized protein (TIGR02186 family)
MRALIIAALLLALPARAQDAPLVAALSSHLVAITTGFTGTDVLLFGATDGPGDIAIVVRGPATTEVVRRKSRFGPIWTNRAEMAFRDVPSYYGVASNRPLNEFAPELLLSRFQIGFDNLRLTPVDPAVTAEQSLDFRKALIRLKAGEKLYDQGLGAVTFMSNRLFRTDLHFPSNVPTGTYLVEVYLFREGEVASAEIVPLNISQIGVSAEIFDFAHNLAPLYGLAAILLAVAAGWAASALFRRT